MSLLNNFCSLVQKTYPSTQVFSDLPERSQYLISDELVPLPVNVYSRAKITIDEIYRLSRTADYQNSVRNQSTASEVEILDLDCQNQSVLMGYDFHYDHNTDRLSLIEINTNAAAFLISQALYESKGISSQANEKSNEKIKYSFMNEIHSLGTQSIHAAIIDEQIATQKMVLEFYMYQDLFRSWGWESQIMEFSDSRVVSQNFIYNRFTDFILTRPESSQLRRAYLEKKIILSPNPREYILLADKIRFKDFKLSLQLETLPSTQLLTPENSQVLWENRKNLFFKPRNLYGSKAAYRGASISRKYFEQLLEGQFIAQDFTPPGEYHGWKFDLRFYVYQNEIQLVIARLYKGQVTNFGHLGGGLACVRFGS